MEAVAIEENAKIRRSKLLELLRKPGSSGVITFKNSQKRNDFFERVNIYREDLFVLGYTFNVLRENSEEVVLIYSKRGSQ